MVAPMLVDKLCLPAHPAIQYIGKSPTSEAYIFQTFDLNVIQFVRLVKMPYSVTFQKFGPVAPNLHNTVFDDII